MRAQVRLIVILTCLIGLTALLGLIGFRENYLFTGSFSAGNTFTLEMVLDQRGYNV